MPFWNRSNNGITDEQRLTVLRLAASEDFSLDEIVQKFDSLATAREVMEDLDSKKMLEFFWKQPKGGREPIPHAQVHALLESDQEWVRPKSFDEAYVIAVANDKGWRWFQAHWRPDS